MSKMNEDKYSSKIFAFNKLYIENVKGLVNWATRFVDRSVAEDIVQNVFIFIWKNNETMSFENSLKPYLFKAVKNQCLNYLESAGNKNTKLNDLETKLKIEEINYYNDSFYSDTENELLTQIFDEVEKLPEKCKEIFKLSYYEGKRSAEISQMFKISNRTVETHIYNALKTLRKVFLTKV